MKGNVAMNWPTSVTIKEVGPKDEFQNEKVFIPKEDKIAWINQLSCSGLKNIEITSFVNPR
jgi:hydroxymethylglutaryl-CoA lyase